MVERHNIVNSRQTDFGFGVVARAGPGNLSSPDPPLSVRSFPYDLCHGWDLPWWLPADTYITAVLLVANSGMISLVTFVVLFVSYIIIRSDQSLSCVRLCDPMNRSTPGLPVHQQLPEFTQTHVHRVSDAIQPSHPLSSPSPPAPNPSQHQSLFQ